mmetsp:Transcript_3737/g.7413  ORF Transcript_3737/g.7413 Transcript_3737/m.7413 type:complete len:524 (+) Transcript_3737:63-1634(+)
MGDVREGDVREGRTGRVSVTPRRQSKRLNEKVHDYICHTPCSCWLPTLLVDPKDDRHFRTTCALALSCLGEDDPKDFSGRWSMTHAEKMELLDEIESVIHPSHRTSQGSHFAWQADASGEAALPEYLKNSMLELGEIIKFQKDHHQRIMQLPNAVHGICDPHLVAEAFKKYDLDQNDSLDVHEWSDFLNTLAIENLKSLLRDALIGFRAFFARGQLSLQDSDSKNYDVEQLRNTMMELANSGKPSTIPLDRESTLYSRVSEEAPLSGRRASPPHWQCSWDGPHWLPVGWWPDLVYYSANNHPLHGIFACDNEHPLSWIERLVMEVASIGFSAATLALHDRWVIQHRGLDESMVILGNEFIFSLLVVTLPSIVMWWTLFLLFTCAKCHPNEAKVPEQEAVRARNWRYVGAFFGYMLVILGIAGWFSLRYFSHIGSRMHRRRLLKGRLKAYFFATFMMVMVYFNPFVAWGQPVPGEPFLLGDYIGLGQWRIEKQRFQAMCLTGAEKIAESRDSREAPKATPESSR